MRGEWPCTPIPATKVISQGQTAFSPSRGSGGSAPPGKRKHSLEQRRGLVCKLQPESD